jgi:hypothetical protein
MPKELHDKLARTARKKGYTGERAKKYIFGTMNKILGNTKNIRKK